MKQSLLEKLEILGAAAKYDVSCASSGSDRAGKSGFIGNNVGCGICHSWTDDGRCVSLLKVLMSNYCIYNCAYCANRRENDIKRASFTPEELAEVAMEFYKRNYIEGIFISSGVIISPTHTMEMFIRTLRLIREKYRFNGYIHVKVIPGADPELITQVGLLADRVSVNIELAAPKALKLLANDKTHADILTPMANIRDKRLMYKDESKKYRNTPSFIPAGQSTQLIVGAVRERDLALIRLTQGLYRQFGMRRVYFSAYIPTNSGENLPALNTAPPLVREHRLYQADFLLRQYKFAADEILDEKNPNLDLDVDPKISYALRNPSLFPVEINSADLDVLLRVPGIGPISAERIFNARKFGSLDVNGLKKLGVVLKRAKFFITVKGKHIARLDHRPELLHDMLADFNPDQQLTLYGSLGENGSYANSYGASAASYPNPLNGFEDAGAVATADDNYVLSSNNLLLPAAIS